MEQPKLVISSVLKPVTDTRMYEKIGRSIGQTKKYEVNIIGFYRKNLPNETNIKFHPIFNFNRLSLGRIFCGFRYFSKLVSLKPKYIICCTHELLIPSVIYASLSSSKIIYDLQENYFRNILFTDAFPWIARFPIAVWVRLKEYITRPFITNYLLAEKCYRKELLFTKNKSYVIENKTVKPDKNKKHRKTYNPEIIQLLFSGTIAKTTGIFECIELAKSLFKTDPSIRLNIVGYCSKKSILLEVNNAIKNYDFIQLIGGDKIVDHNTIVDHILASHFGLIYYPASRANDSSIPTKLYEYLGYQLPIILEQKNSFTQLADVYTASININYNSYDPIQILEEMRNGNFYKIEPRNEVFWESEELKLLSII